jgi:D-alanyl-D-alanine dipeptidase
MVSSGDLNPERSAVENPRQGNVIITAFVDRHSEAIVIERQRSREVPVAGRTDDAFKVPRTMIRTLSVVLPKRKNGASGCLHRSIVAGLLFFVTGMPSLTSAQTTRPPSFVDAATVVPNLAVEMRYHGSNNFVGKPVDGYERPVCLLTRQAAGALASVQRSLAPRGLGLKVFDCYRPARATRHFLRWAADPNDPGRSAEFNPGISKPDLFRLGYLSARSGHSRGSTVDLTLVRLSDRRELDMGTIYDFSGPRAWLSNRSVSADVQANRHILVEAMRAQRFIPYVKEWWHYTLAGEPFPATFFDFPVR